MFIHVSTNSPADLLHPFRLGNTALHYMAMGDFESDMMLHAMKSSKIKCNIENQVFYLAVTFIVSYLVFTGWEYTSSLFMSKVSNGRLR